jgi:hypothetical protein
VRPYAKVKVESLAGKDMHTRNRKAVRTPLGSVLFLIVAVFLQACFLSQKTDKMILMYVVFGPTWNSMSR